LDIAEGQAPIRETSRINARRRRAVACSATALLGGLVYLNALHNPFVYDDYHTVVDNTSLENLANLRTIVVHAVTRPIINVSYAVDRAIWGAGPFGFHVTNVLLHMVNVVLLFQLVCRLLERHQERKGLQPTSATGAFVAASLFAVHPMMTEAVGYVSGRSEVLCATFFLSGLFLGNRWLQSGGVRWAIPTTGLWVAALATKEIAATFPFVLLAYDWLLLSGTKADRRKRLTTVHAPLVGIALVAGVARLLILARVEYPGEVAIHWPYVLLALEVTRRYIWLLVAPGGQTIFHSVAGIESLADPRAWLSIVTLGLVLAAAWRARQTEAIATFGALWFLLLLVPSSVLMILDQGEPMAEHRIYLASCGAFLLAGAAASHLSRWLTDTGSRLRILSHAAVVTTLVALGAQTIARNTVWASPVTLWQESVNKAPTHYRPRLLLGEALLDTGRVDEAIVQFRTAVNLRPQEPTGYVKLGVILAETGRQDEARRYFLEALAVDPNNASARRSLSLLDEAGGPR
jgi:hypothetical protein